MGITNNDNKRKKKSEKIAEEESWRNTLAERRAQQRPRRHVWHPRHDQSCRARSGRALPDHLPLIARIACRTAKSPPSRAGLLTCCVSSLPLCLFHRLSKSLIRMSKRRASYGVCCYEGFG